MNNVTCQGACHSFSIYPYDDVSFLNRKQLLIDGDVESNPGPMVSIEAHRACIGRFHDKCKRLSNIEEFNTNVMFFQCIFKLFGFAF